MTTANPTPTANVATANVATANVAELLARVPASPARFIDRDALAAPMAELRRLRDQLDPRLADGDDLRERIAERLGAYEAKFDRLVKLDDARAEVEARLAHTRKMFDDGAQVTAVDAHYVALESFLEGLLSGPDWDREELGGLEGLKGRVAQTRERFLNDHERPTTRQEAGELADLILGLNEQVKRDPEHLITYFITPAVSSPMQQMTVKDALPIARRLLFKKWDEKIGEYLETARQLLDVDHAPREAFGVWKRCERLPGRENPDLGVTLSEDLIGDIERMRARIDAAQKARDAAETELRRANNALEPPAVDALAAETHRALAEQHDPRVPSLAECQARIVAAATHELPTLLTAAEDYLRHEAWPQTATDLQRAGLLLGLLPAVDRPNERTRHSTLHAAYDAVKPLIDGRPLPLLESRDRLDQLAVLFADSYWPSWSGLARRRDRLHTVSRLDSLLQQVNAACQPQGEVGELEDLAQALAELQATPPADAPRETLARLPSLARRVAAWLGFARARDELAKVPKVSPPINIVPDELDSLADNVADLRVVADGLAAAGDDNGARDAANRANPPLSQQMARLQQNDETSGVILKRALALLGAERPTAEQLQDQLRALQTALSKPSSHRHDLFNTYHDLRDRLVRRRRTELQQLLDGQRPDYFAGMAEDDLGRRLDEIKRLWRGPADDDPDYVALAAEVTLARALARAHRTEGRIAQNLSNWTEAQQAWETARTKAPDSSEAFDYAHHRSRLARKQAVFEEAARSDASAAVELLKGLTNDPTLRDDWEAWYRHGRAALELARTRVAPNQTFSLNMEHLDSARDNIEAGRLSLRRAVSLAQGQQLDTAQAIESRNHLIGLNDVIDQWDILLRALAHYRDALHSEWPTHADCLAMAQTHEATVRHLKESRRNGQAADLPDAPRWYDELWKQTRNIARGRLDQRLQALPPAAILEQLDVLLGLALLFPDDANVQGQLNNQALQILAALQALVTNTVGDYGGSAFGQRFLSREKRAPSEEEFLVRQIEEARQTALSLTQYQQTLERLEPNGLRVNRQHLANQAEQVSDWIDELEQFHDALDSARQLAEDGLANQHQFEKALRILRLAQSPYADLAQVASGFSNASHPTYRWVKAKIEADIALRQQQEALLGQIGQLIEREQQGVTLALRWRHGDTLSQTEQAQVGQLVSDLRQLRSLLRQVIEAAPDDPTLLQQELVYRLPEAPHDPDRESRGASNVEKAVAAKIDQYKRVNLWLGKWSEGDALRNVTDWPRTRARLVEWRNSGPMGLNNARLGCIEAREGDTGGHCGGLWALRPAFRALSGAELNTAIGATPGDGEPLWYGVIEPLNQRRLALRRLLAQQIEDNERLESNVRWRSSEYQVRLDQVMARRGALLAARRLPWMKWLDMPAWNDFRQAAEAFCEICPRDQVFVELCAEIADYTGLTIYCPDEPEASVR